MNSLGKSLRKQAQREHEQRMAALMAATEERERQQRLLADVRPDEPAKVRRVKVEPAEPSPREKFSGCRP